MNSDLPYIVGFSAFPGIGPVRFRLLLNYFSSAKAAWEAPEATLLSTGLGEKLTRSFVAFRARFDAKSYIQRLNDLLVRTVSLTDERYPKRLKEIPDAPFLLYVRGKPGKTRIDLDRAIAVVGTRRVSRYGEEMTERIVTGLVAAGCPIVSGMAYGVDAVAHRTALSCGGQTVAVLGCGVDVIAPASNTALYWDIINSGRGAVVSEMPLGLRPNKGMFPARNRIVSGMSIGVVVMEGTHHSGALITARYAAEQGREVFAVPGSVTNPLSQASSVLIKNGATLVESSEDIVSSLGFPAGASQVQTVPKKQDPRIQRILDILSFGPKHIDDIVRESGLTMEKLAGILTVLELDGIVKDLGERTYGLM